MALIIADGRAARARLVRHEGTVGWTAHPPQGRSPVASHPRPLLRPDWVLTIAKAVNAFATALPDGGASPTVVDAFVSTLPPPHSDLEVRFFGDLRDGLVASHGLAGRNARAEQARLLLVSDYRTSWTLESLARAVGCNRTTLQEEFHRVTGTSVHRFLVGRRVREAQRLLVVSDVKASRVSHEVGFRSASAFGRHFKRLTGVTLSAYRAAAATTPIAVRDQVPAERARLRR
jgi:AraC-like DNA-binding protein